MDTTTNHITLPTLQRIGGAALAGAVAALLVANFLGTEGENGGPTEFAVSAVVCVLIGIWLFARVIPRAVEAGAEKAGAKALVLGTLAAVTVLAFWSGLPYVLGPAAVALGLAARARGANAAATVGIGLGSVGFVAAVAILILDKADQI